MLRVASGIAVGVCQRRLARPNSFGVALALLGRSQSRMSRLRSSHTSPDSPIASDSEPQPRTPETPKWHALVTPVCVLVPLLLFAFLAEDIYSHEQIRFDDPLLLRFHRHASLFFDSLMVFLSRVGGLPILAYTAVLVGLLAWRKQRAQWTFLLLAMVGTCLLNIALKTAFGRTRPDLWLSIAPEHDFSFPSGHSMLSSTWVLALLVLTWKSDWSLAAKCAATVVGLSFVIGVISSRLYLGVHFPSDVLAGFCLSLSWVSLLAGIFKRRLSRVLPLSSNR